jgi:hypothetical protein
MWLFILVCGVCDMVYQGCVLALPLTSINVMISSIRHDFSSRFSIVTIILDHSRSARLIDLTIY